MAKYNLINTGIIISNTTDGNKSLTTEELHSLYDGNTTSSGVALVNTDVLYLDIDFFNRLIVDDFNLYITVPGDRESALVKVDFYYKNNETDTYTLCSKEQDANTFHPINLPSIFAPRFIRIVVDTLECSIYELEIKNDDTVVSFGEDGNDISAVIDTSSVGYDSLPIFNSAALGTPSVTAYVIVDYEGNDSDGYVSISSSPTGEYLSVYDGAFLGGNITTSDFRWSQGSFEDTIVYGTSVMLDASSSDGVGYYTTPIISVGDPFTSSFLMSNTTVLSGTEITWSPGSEKPVVKVKSSNNPPLALTKVFWCYTKINIAVVFEGDLVDGEINTDKIVIPLVSGTYPTTPHGILFDKFNNRLIISYYYSNKYRIAIYDYSHASTNNAPIYITAALSNEHKATIWGSDPQGNIWMYCTTVTYNLRVLTSNLTSETVLIDGDTTNFITDLAVSLVDSSCWFSDSAAKMLKCINSVGAILCSVSLGSPTYICTLYDGTCWVVDSSTKDISLYNVDGTLVKTFKHSFSSIIDLECVTSETQEQLWALVSGGAVVRMDFDGNILADKNIGGATNLTPFDGGCIVSCNSLGIAYQLNNSCEIVNTWNFTSLGTVANKPCVAMVGYEEVLKQTATNPVIPLPKDPVWGTTSEDNWVEIVNNDYILPLVQYHQFKYKFSGVYLSVPITNPGFETGNYTGWVNSNISYLTVSTTKPHSGTYCIYTSQSNVNYWVSQVLDLSSIPSIDFDYLDQEEEYFFGVSVWGYSFGGNSNIRLQVKYLDEYSIEITGADFISQSSNSALGWGRVYYCNKLWKNTRYVKIFGIIGSYGAMDDFEAHIIVSPELNNINIPKPTKIVDVQPQQSKNVYIKTDYPPNSPNIEYESKLKCWWGIEEN